MRINQSISGANYDRKSHINSKIFINNATFCLNLWESNPQNSIPVSNFASYIYQNDFEPLGKTLIWM